MHDIYKPLLHFHHGFLHFIHLLLQLPRLRLLLFRLSFPVLRATRIYINVCSVWVASARWRIYMCLPELCETSAGWETWLGRAGAAGLPVCPVSRACPSPAASWPPRSPASDPPGAPAHAPAPDVMQCKHAKRQTQSNLYKKHSSCKVSVQKRPNCFLQNHLLPHDLF